MSNALRRALPSTSVPIISRSFPARRITEKIQVIQTLCDEGMFQTAYSIFSQSKSTHIYKGLLFNPILWGLCKYEHTNYSSLAFFGLLSKKGYIFNVYSYTALVYGFCKWKLWDDVFSCLDEMGRVGCEANVVTYTIVLKFLCDEGRVEEALRVLDYWERSKGCEFNLISYNVVIRELCRQDKRVELDEILRVIEGKGFSADLYTYTAVAGGMIESGKPEIASRYLRDLVEKGCELDVVGYNMLLHSICCNGNSREALIFMQEMEKVGFRPNNSSYNTIIKGLCKDKDFEGALRLFDLADWINGPDMISFNTILSAACEVGDSAMIEWVSNRMKLEGVRFDVVSSTCLIQYYFSLGRIDDCLKLVESMVANGPWPNTITLNTVLAGLCKNRLLVVAEKMFCCFKDIGVSPDTTTYNILMRASIRQGNYSMLYELSRDMNRQKVKPDIGIHGCLIYRTCQDGNILFALHLRDQLRENEIPPNIFIYNTIMKTMFNRGMFREIVTLFKDMAMDGCEPNQGSLYIWRQAKINGWMKGFPRAWKIVELFMCGNVP